MTVLLLIFFFMVFPKGLAYRTIVVPILYVLWVTELALRIIPQPVVWAIFMVLAFIILVKSLSNPQKSRRRIYKPATRHLGRVEELAKLIQFSRKWSYSRWNLAHHLAELASEILAFRERCTSKQIQERLEDGVLKANWDIRAYFQAGMKKEMSWQTGLFSKIKHWRRSQELRSPLDLDPENAVHFLEDQLKIPYDNENR